MTRFAPTFAALSLVLSAGQVAAGKGGPFRPEPGKFAPLDKAVPYRGELVFVDHVNRRGSLRLHVDDHYHEGKLHHFAMLPYGVIRFRGAPAELHDIPLGTVLYGRFFLPQDPKTSAVPVVKGTDVTQPPENYAILLEDGPSLCLRENKAWQLREVEIKGSAGKLLASLDRAEGGEGLGGEHSLTIDGSTRIWRGRELLGIGDLLEEGAWPASGKKPLDGQLVQISLTWHPRYLYQEFHVADLWLDEAAMANATERQRGRHLRHVKLRWMPARVDAVDHGEFGHATITATLFGGMDASLYADFKQGGSATMAAAADTLRTWWPNHDGMEGKLLTVGQPEGEPPFGSSGVQLQFEVDLVLEGFRPGRTVRIRAAAWPKVKPPYEELIKSMESRWPGPEIFGR